MAAAKSVPAAARLTRVKITAMSRLEPAAGRLKVPVPHFVRTAALDHADDVHESWITAPDFHVDAVGEAARRARRRTGRSAA